MTINDLLNDHTRRVEAVILWHAMGWINDKEWERYLVCETEATEALYDQVVKEAHYSGDCRQTCPYVRDDCEDVQLQDIMT